MLCKRLLTDVVFFVRLSSREGRFFNLVLMNESFGSLGRTKLKEAKMGASLAVPDFGSGAIIIIQGA